MHGSATAWMSAINPDEHWDWAASAILVRTGQSLPRLTSPPERVGGVKPYYRVSQARFSTPMGDGDVFEVAVGEVPEAHPRNDLWEVMFPSRSFYVVRPLRVPDHVSEA